MKVYTIATENKGNDAYESYDNLVIEKMGGWGTGEFPPLFRTRARAIVYLNKAKILCGRVVELELED